LASSEPPEPLNRALRLVMGLVVGIDIDQRRRTGPDVPTGSLSCAMVTGFEMTSWPVRSLKSA
jgi:hypothetical protein